MSKSHFIKSYGCQMNAYDATRMADVLAEQGFVPAASEQDADLIILNTCHIREKATEKVFSELGRLRHADNTKPGRMVAVAGCVAQAEGEELLRRAPEIDMVFGPQTYHRLPEFLAEAKRRREDSGAKTGRQARGVLDTEFPAETKFGALPEPRRVQPAMFLTVQEGCDKFCTFCVVPYTRGAEYSRPAADVLHEAERLVAGGARELVLLGQNVNAWHGDGISAGGSWNFAALLRELARRYPGVRLRYTTSHPLEMDDDLVRAHGELEALMPFLHLPVQSGSDRILAAMNRRHRADDYRAIVAKLRAARPDLGLSSDFITGFPGETDADFAATLALADEIGFAMAYSFRYSPRPGTPAAEMDAQVPEDVSAERLARLQALLTSQQHAFNTATIGRSCEVLFERQGRHAGQLVGRSPWNQAVAVADTDPALIGSIQRVRIEGLNNFSLRGRIDDAKAAA